ncbi:MAG: hypothetical protein HY905_06175 [Deltaproteobacteria bacterium]|nr:hypothetical protein [Deltaproteobacteria bacterium]
MSRLLIGLLVALSVGCSDADGGAGDSGPSEDTSPSEDAGLESDSGVPPCSAQDEACEGEIQGNDDFWCDVEHGRCEARCRVGTVFPEPEPCPAGTYCRPGPVSGDRDGSCVLGDCNDGCFDPAECPGTAFTCDDGAGTCLAVGNGASACFAAGTAAAGEGCDPTSGAEGDTCAPGLLCFQGICETPCAYDAGDPGSGCSGAAECVPVFDHTADNRPGVCASPCGPFSSGECGPESRCDPAFSSISGTITAWVCTPLAAGVPVVGLGGPCDADPADGLEDQCDEGLWCRGDLPFDSAGRCVQHCDFTLRSDAGLATCPATDPAPTCAPTGVTGFGMCLPTCTPFFPGVAYSEGGVSNERWRGNGCTQDDATGHYAACIPFLTTGANDVVMEADGPPDLSAYCAPRAVAAAGDFGAECSSDDDCNPDAFCVPMDGAARCAKLCQPFSGAAESDCAPGLVCFNTAEQAYGFCVQPQLPAAEADSCTAGQSGLACAADDTFCLELTPGSAQCVRLCKRELNDPVTYENPGCPPLPSGGRRTCREDVTFASSVPAWLSICGDAP